MYLRFEKVPQPVLLEQGLKLLPHLVRVFAKWPFREVPGERHGDPAVGILRDGDCYILQAPWLDVEQRYETAADVVDALAYHVTRAWMGAHQDVIGINAAAARFGNELVVFVGGPRSGKSLLVSCLAASGQMAFADSILPVSAETRCGVGLGIAPRLRLPLPDALSGTLRTLVEQHIESGADHLGYLKPHKTRLGSFGDAVSIRAFVLLDRSEGGTTSLRPTATGTVLKRLLLGSFDALPSAHRSLALLHDLVGDAACYKLTWSDPTEAVSALRARFAILQPQSFNDETGGIKPKKALQRRASGPRQPSGRRFRHVEGLGERQVDGDLFLVDPGGEAIYHLNELGAGLWRLLDRSHGQNDAVSLLRDAYPLVNCDDLAEDVERLISDLTERGLLIEKKAGEAG
jgi:hypothetical protein